MKCGALSRWRNISPAVQRATVGSSDSDPWYCAWNSDRAGASCDQPDDYDTAARQGWLGQ